MQSFGRAVTMLSSFIWLMAWYNCHYSCQCSVPSVHGRCYMAISRVRIAVHSRNNKCNALHFEPGLIYTLKMVTSMPNRFFNFIFAVIPVFNQPTSHLNGSLIIDVSVFVYFEPIMCSSMCAACVFVCGYRFGHVLFCSQLVLSWNRNWIEKQILLNNFPNFMD